MSLPAIVCLNPSVDRRLSCAKFAAGVHARVCRAGDVAGGKGVNVARKLAECLAPAGLAPSKKAILRPVLYGFVGRERAAFFREQLKPFRLINRLTPVPAPTRFCYTFFDSANQTETHFREAGDPLPAGALESLLPRLSAPAARKNGVLFSGSLPPGVTRKAWRELLLRLADKGIPVGVDASGWALSEAVRAGAVFIKPNRDELGGLAADMGYRASAAPDAARAIFAPSNWMRFLLDRFPRLTILASDGPHGAYLGGGSPSSPFSAHPAAGGQKTPFGSANPRMAKNLHPFNKGQSFVYLEAPRVQQVRTTVGAGDALLAGYLHALILRLPPVDTLAAGMRVAARHVRRR